MSFLDDYVAFAERFRVRVARARAFKAQHEEGQWVTTDTGAHILIKDGQAVGGNPKVVASVNADEKSAAKPEGYDQFLNKANAAKLRGKTGKSILPSYHAYADYWKAKVEHEAVNSEESLARMEKAKKIYQEVKVLDAGDEGQKESKVAAIKKKEPEKKSKIATAKKEPSMRRDELVKKFRNSMFDERQRAAKEIMSDEDIQLSKSEFKEVGEVTSHVSALRSFTTLGFTKINKNPNSREAKKTLQAVKKLPAISSYDEGELTRGIRLFSEEDQQKTIDSYFHPDGKPKEYEQSRTLSSWTARKKPPNEVFTKSSHPVIFKVVKYKSARSIEFVSFLKEERERVFAIGTKFRGISYLKKGNTAYITLEEV